MDFEAQLYAQTGHRRARRIAEIQVVFIATVSVLNILAVKMTGLYFNGEVVKLFGYLPMYFSVGALLYAVTFPCTDIVSELVGQKTAARMVWRGFFCSLGVVTACQLAIILPAAEFWTLQEAYAAVLGGVSRIMLASMLSYTFSQRFDVFFFDRAIAASRKHGTTVQMFTNSFWKRALGTTVISQLLDSIIFISVAFWGTKGIPFTLAAFANQIVPIIVTTWIVKSVLTIPLVGIIFLLERWIGYSNEERLPDEVYLAQQAEKQ